MKSLSVGDISFQAKCAQKMRELLSSGATIILVSHQISLIQSLCKRAILLNHGEVIKDGPSMKSSRIIRTLRLKAMKRILNVRSSHR